MAIICRKHKLLFIMVPATGCSTIGEVLQKQCGGERLGRKHSSLAELLHYKLVSAPELKAYLSFAAVRNPFDRFASQYQRLVGEWMESMVDTRFGTWTNTAPSSGPIRRWRKRREVKRARALGFETWLARQLKRPDRLSVKMWQSAKRLGGGYVLESRYRGFPLVDGVDEVIRYENLEGDFNNILRKVGIDKDIALPLRNPTPGKKPYQEYYTPNARAMLEECLRDELPVFGYTADTRADVPTEMAAN